MLTAKGDLTDRVAGLELRPDDYLPKPFEPRELVARIQSVLRRTHTTVFGKAETFGRLKTNFPRQSAALDGGPMDLTTSEFIILSFLAVNTDIVLDRDQILNELSGIDCEAYNRTVDVTVSRLRQKLGDDSKHPEFIKTIWGSGYLFLRGTRETKKMNRFKTFIHSVYAKLIVTCLITWVCIVLVAVSLLIIHKQDSIRPFHTNAIQYVTYVIADLGAPPDKTRAEAIYNRTGLKISFKGKQGQWSLIKNFPKENDIRFRTFSNSDTIFFGRFHGRNFLKVIHKTGIFVFELPGYDREKNRYLWVFLISMTLIVIGAYLAIKKTLRPIKWLHKGVQEVGQGNLLHTIPEDRKDEFGKLAAAFNTMTGQLQQMLDLKQQLLRDVSHELRSPLTRMKVALEFLDDAHDDQVKKSIATDIREMQAMVTAILENALKYSPPESHPVEIHLNKERGIRPGTRPVQNHHGCPRRKNKNRQQFGFRHPCHSDTFIEI